MNFETLKAVLATGGKHGDAFKEILAYYSIADNDLSKITEEMAQEWLAQKGDKKNDSCNNSRDTKV